MTRTPVMGYTGYIVLSPKAVPPPVPQALCHGADGADADEVSEN